MGYVTHSSLEDLCLMCERVCGDDSFTRSWWLECGERLATTILTHPSSKSHVLLEKTLVSGVCKVYGIMQLLAKLCDWRERR